MYKSKRAKATDIPKKVKDKVWQRDHERCIYCGYSYAMPNAHYLSRQKGGKGIEQNIVTLCLTCHSVYDQGSNDVKKYYAGKIGKPIIDDYIKSYLSSIYGEDFERGIRYEAHRKIK